MTISSMTGFARASSSSDDAAWQWDVRSVNGKSFDVRFRLPAGFEHLEAQARGVLNQVFKRGNLQASLTYEDRQPGDGIVVNEAALEQIVAVAERLRQRIGGGPANIEALLNVRGIVEPASRPLDEAAAQARDAACLATLAQAAQVLKRSRDAEGKKILPVVMAAVDRIEALTQKATVLPSRKPEMIKAKLKEQLDRLLDAPAGIDQVRLHQEAMIAATRVDVQEELDRLMAHVSSARDIIGSGEPAGKRLDFLAQEFNREANTLCSKSNDIALTHIGLDLKNVIDQLREQIQNIE
jgi:uncharacterized protein (TIGR00255 family)